MINENNKIDWNSEELCEPLSINNYYLYDLEMSNEFDITLINKLGNKMSRKDYIQLARIIKDNTIINNNLFESISKKGFIDDLCDVLKQDNINFDRLRFINACND